LAGNSVSWVLLTLWPGVCAVMFRRHGLIIPPVLCLTLNMFALLFHVVMSHCYYHVSQHNYLCNHRALHINNYSSSVLGGHYCVNYHYVADLSCHANSVVRQSLAPGTWIVVVVVP
jgi:hypothetical protein